MPVNVACGEEVRKDTPFVSEGERIVERSLIDRVRGELENELYSRIHLVELVPNPIYERYVVRIR